MFLVLSLSFCCIAAAFFSVALFVTHNYTEYNLQWNVFSTFNPSKCTNSGQPTLRHPGSSRGFGALLKGFTSVVDTSSRSRDSNPQPWITFMHLADAFIQRDLDLHSGYTFSLVCVFPGNRTHNLFALLTQCHWATQEHKSNALSIRIDTQLLPQK